MEMAYKLEMGAHTIPRAQFLAKLSRARDNCTEAPSLECPALNARDIIDSTPDQLAAIVRGGSSL